MAQVACLVPSKKSNPGLDIVVQLQLHILRLRYPATGMGNLILGFLVLESNESTEQSVRLCNCGSNVYIDLPIGVNGLSFSAALELLHSNRSNVLEMIGTGACNDLVPDDSLVCRVVGAGPLGSDIDKDLLGVPCEESSQIGIQVESNDGIFLLLGTVVVRSALDAEKRRQLANSTWIWKN